MADKERIGVIGLGIMGKPMARNLMSAGHEVVVYDLFPEPVEELVTDGAVLGTSPADVASKSDVTVVMVQNSPQSTTVSLGENGIIEAADRGQLVVDMSSIAPLISQKIGEELADAGIDFLDAPVSGGEPGAIAGTLAIMVGGTQAAFDRAAPIFDATGASAVLCGDIGAGGFNLNLAAEMEEECGVRNAADIDPFDASHGVDDLLCVLNPGRVNGEVSDHLRVRCGDHIDPRHIAPTLADARRYLAQHARRVFVLSPDRHAISGACAHHLDYLGLTVPCVGGNAINRGRQTAA